MNINGETKIIGFFGSSYKNSKMFAVYNAAFEALQLNFAYVSFIVTDLKQAVDGVRNLGIHALGITIPYKVEIIKYLDELDENAERIGAVNVVVNKNGKLIGGNTDGEGAVMALQEKIEVKNKRVVLLGAGGAARAIAVALLDAGSELTIINRSIDKAKALAETVGCSFGGLSDIKQYLATAEIVVNATSVGMTGGDAEEQSIVPLEALRSGMTVMDIVPKPRETQLLEDARAKRCTVVYGDRMLLWQAVKKFSMFTAVEPPIEIMERAMVGI